MRIAIFGCGQLAMMMAQAAKPLNIDLCFIAEPQEDTRCVNGLGDIVRYDETTSAAALFAALDKPDVITVDREQVDPQLLTALADYCEVHPSVEAIKTTQNRFLEKQTVNDQGFATAPFDICANLEELKNTKIRPPFIIKHPTSGYDGKSQWRIDTQETLNNFDIDPQQFPLLVEEKINFRCEASMIGVRSSTGEIRFYPPTINEHVNGILLKSTTIADSQLAEQLLPAKEILTRLLTLWNYVGVLSLELFVTDQGLLVNELAPRVHNSGHWTMNGCACSQFENHMRAISGQALGPTEATSPAGMVNLLGIDAIPEEISTSSSVYWYNKTLKPLRKMGHINVVNNHHDRLVNKLGELAQQLYSNSGN